MDSNSKISVLMFPWLGHGHISPFLELAKILVKRNFTIYLCSTPANLGSVRQKLSEKYSLSIQLVELHLPSLPDLPPSLHTTNGLPSHLMPTLKKALDLASPSFTNILKTLKPDLLIYDLLQPWAPVAASALNIPAVVFIATSATMASSMFHLYFKHPMRFPFSSIFYRGYERDHVTQVLESSAGPLVEDPVLENGDSDHIIEWLDAKGKGSTVFVSFGSEYFLSDADLREIAHGLELSNVNFIWVVRFPKGGEKIKVEEKLPKGFIEKVGEKGKIVEGWAPQARILGHSSIGGFVSHCGWSSVMESMKFGVPIIAMPMHLDQPINARLVEEVGVGVEVVRDMSGRLKRETVAVVVKNVVVDKVGEVVREKARKMSESMRMKGDEEIDEVVEELVQLYADSKRVIKR